MVVERMHNHDGGSGVDMVVCRLRSVRRDGAQHSKAKATQYSSHRSPFIHPHRIVFDYKLQHHNTTMSSEEPNTAVVLIGNDIFFKPGSNAISATTTKREDLSTCLESKAEPSSLDSFHLIMKASSVATLFDPDALSSFLPLLRPNAEFVVHIMENPGEEDVDTVKMALVLANLRVESQQAGEGALIISSRLVQ